MMMPKFQEVLKMGGALKVPLMFVLIFIILLVGQYASKTGALHLNQNEPYTALIFIAIGYSCLVSRGLIWIVLLKYVRLSVAYPIQAFSFVLITLLGVLVFNEILSLEKILGMILIISGVTAISLSK